MIRKLIAGSLLAGTMLMPGQVLAGQVLGVHVLHPAEINEAVPLLRNENNQDDWAYITIPLSLNDLEKKDEWQQAFNNCYENKLIPIVRFVSRFDAESGAWAVPTRAEILSYFDFLNGLAWPSEEKLIIVFNEVNHAAEWGGEINPGIYADVLRFTADWAHTEGANYKVLAAAMDLAAPNGDKTMEAFNYMGKMLESEPEIFNKIDYWNSHSYPNPAFSSAPTATGQNTLTGYIHELEWLKEKTGLEPRVFITETGWQENSSTKYKLMDYYDYAAKNIWDDERIVAVTPFVLKGDPGPFEKFTLIDKDGEASMQYEALKEAIDYMSESGEIAVASF